MSLCPVGHQLAPAEVLVAKIEDEQVDELEKRFSGEEAGGFAN